MKRVRVVLWCLLLAACSGEQGPLVRVGAGQPDPLFDEPRSILVELQTDEDLEAPVPAGAQGEAVLERRSKVFRAQADQLREALPDGVHVGHTYSHLPMMHLLVVTPEALGKVEQLPGVRRVWMDEVHTTQLSSSLALVNQPQVQARGLTGGGTTVAVLDTGVDYTRAAFGSCSAPGGSCKVSVAMDFAPDDGVKDAHGHGTNVAGIVLGMAPDTRIAALDVFNGGSGYSSDIIAAVNWCVANRAAHNLVAMNLSLGSGGYAQACPSDVFASPLTTARAAGIVPVVATGNAGYLDRISSPACVPAAVSVGAVHDSAYGPFSGGACSDSVTAADKVTCFSNAAAFMTMLAPGSLITAAGLTMAGTSQAAPHVAGAVAVVASAFPTESAAQWVTRLVDTGVTVTDARTGRTHPRLDIQAATLGCPMAVSTPAALPAGGGSLEVTVTTDESCAWTAQTGAAWLSVSPSSGSGSAVLTLQASTNTGAARSSTLSVGGKVVAVSQAADTQAPSGTVSIQGNPTWVTSTTVQLVLSASDASGVPTACISNTATCSAFAAFTSPKAWTLAAGAGAKTVRVWFRDGQGNTAITPATVNVGLDNVAPTNGAVTVTRSGGGALRVAWTGFSDANSGIATYKVVAALGATAPANCTSGTTVCSTASTECTHSGLTNGAPVAYRVCAADVAGNLSTGVTASGVPQSETTPPTGTVSIVGNPSWVNTTSVQLALAASDASGVASACISNTGSCTTFAAFTSPTAWTLASGVGAKTVSVWFRDTQGNTMASPATATVNLDTVVPVTGTATVARAGSGALRIGWSGFSDAASGVAGYRVVSATGTSAPASCAVGAVACSTAANASECSVTGLTNGTAQSYRVCAVDRAGNAAAGVALTATPVPESNPPTGTVSIRGNPTWVSAVGVTLDLAAQDASGVASMCISNTSTCSAWKPYASSLAWNLAAGSGAKTVSAWFRDPWGFVSAPATVSVGLDVTKPVVPTLTATGGDAQVSLQWASGAADAHSGVSTFEVRGMSGTAAPATCTDGTRVYLGSATSTVHTGLTNGTRWNYRLCVTDAVGNAASGVPVSAVPAPEYTAPTGTVTVAGGAAWTNLTEVPLTLSASDASGVTHMCISNTTTCSAFVPYATSATWTLTTTAGEKVVRVWFRDRWGNTTATPASDTIQLDRLAPTPLPVLTATPGNAQVSLSWTASTDAASGLARYKVVFQQGATAPTNCTQGTTLYEGPNRSTVHTGRTNGTAYAYRVCAVDGAGNSAVSLPVTATPRP